jgi:hypothetical protein
MACNFGKMGERVRNANRVLVEKSLENCLLERQNEAEETELRGPSLCRLEADRKCSDYVQ